MWSPQVLDAGPRGAANLEAMAVLSTGKKQKVCFFKGDDTPIGSHTVYDFDGEAQDVGMVQTWNQCEQMLLTSQNKPHSILLMDTEKGQCMSELSMRRQQRGWNLQVESITPMMKFDQYKSSNEYQLFGVGDEGHTVFAMNHDSRVGENVEEHVIRADSHRKYKSKFTFTCHAQTKGGYLALGRSDGAVALYDAIMKSENASCVIDSMPGPVTSIDVAADGSMIVWTTPDFVFFTCPADGNWTKTKASKPAVLKLDMSEADQETLSGEYLEGEGIELWRPVKFDASTAKDEHGLREREIISYSGAVQMRWNVRQAKAAWQSLSDDDGAPSFFCGVATKMEGAVVSHITANDDMDVVALENEIVKSLTF